MKLVQRIIRQISENALYTRVCTLHVLFLVNCMFKVFALGTIKDIRSMVSTGMGDCLRVNIPPRYVYNQPPRPTQHDYLSVVRRNEYWRWFRPPLRKKQSSA